MMNPFRFILILSIIAILGFERSVEAYSDVVITQIESVSFEGPAHHGFVIESAGIDDPNLSHYELHIKEDTGNPVFPPYRVYDREWRPYDVKSLNIPYRNGILALQSNKTYCFRIKAHYNQAEAKSWVEICGIELQVPQASDTDADGDGLTEVEEYAYGTDPNNSDSDGDGVDDATEIANGGNPNSYLFGELLVKTKVLYFGLGGPFGRLLIQHQYIEIENVGDDTAYIEDIKVVNGNWPGAESEFLIGAYPEGLSAVAPQSSVRVPISFLPGVRGYASADVQITTSMGDEIIDPIPVSGLGGLMPYCHFSPAAIDFGTVPFGEQNTATKILTISNKGQWPEVPSDAPIHLILKSSDKRVVPTIRRFVLDAEKEMKVPILLIPNQVGPVDVSVSIVSPFCGEQTVSVTGEVASE